MRRLALAMVLAALGCGAEEPEAGGDAVIDCAERPRGEVMVGSGEHAFTPADEGVRITAGPQGGYHIWIGLRCRDLGPQITVYYGVLRGGSDERLSPFGLKRSLELSPAGEAAGLYAYLNSGLDTDALVGEAVTLWAEVTDACNETPARAEAEAEILGYSEQL